MKKFITNLTYFSIFLLLILSCLILITNIELKNKILNDELESKIGALKIDTTQTNIIIAGDSRAERQLIPKIIKEQTGINTVNIASTSCDLVNTVSAIKLKYPSSNSIFIISASSWQINDGAIEASIFSSKSFSECSAFELFALYRFDLSGLYNRKIILTKNFIKGLFSRQSLPPYDKTIINNLGFYGIEEHLKKETKGQLKNNLASHSWYQNFNNNGVRWQLFKRALSEIGSMNSTFIIYQPPASPYWKTYTKNTYADLAEIEYSEKVELEVKNYKNIFFIDFYLNDIPELNNSMYYNYQHLNLQGAQKFTNYLLKTLEDKKLIVSKPL